MGERRCVDLKTEESSDWLKGAIYFAIVCLTLACVSARVCVRIEREVDREKARCWLNVDAE